MGMICEIAVVAPGELGYVSGDPNLLTGAFGGRSPSRERTPVSIEKAWHGLHYLLTGEAWEGEGPLAFLLVGGEEVGEDEESPVRSFSPEETAEIHAALESVSDETLWSRFNAADMERRNIYPGIWDEDEADLREEYLGYFHDLKRILATAADSGLGLLISLG